MKDIIQLKFFSAKLNNILIRDHSGLRPAKTETVLRSLFLSLMQTSLAVVNKERIKQKKCRRENGISTYTKSDINKPFPCIRNRRWSRLDGSLIPGRICHATRASCGFSLHQCKNTLESSPLWSKMRHEWITSCQNWPFHQDC